MAETNVHTKLLMIQAARMYYIDDISKVEIAKRLDVSRFKVARLLEMAREEGIVQITIHAPGHINEARSTQLRDALGLEHAIVVDASALSTEDGATALAQAAGDLLVSLAETTDILGLPWSRMVAASVPYLKGLPPIPIIQLSGALDLGASDISPIDVVRDAVHLTGGEGQIFYAPFAATDPAAARVIRSQAGPAQALSAARNCSIALVGVGAWGEGDSTLYALASQDEKDDLRDLDAVGEISGIFFNATGSPVSSKLGNRLINLSPTELNRIPQVIAVTAGASRAAALKAGIAGGFISSAVVDDELAGALLNE